MNEFVRECRKEWTRLRVPDAVANEMAADLEADLNEVVGEGGSAEELLGTDAFDPRSFARSWAESRGVVPPPPLVAQLPTPSASRPPWRASVVAGVTLFGLLALVGAALTLHRSGSSEASAASFHQIPPPLPMFAQSAHADAFPVLFGLLLLFVGLAGVALTILDCSALARAQPLAPSARRPGSPRAQLLVTAAGSPHVMRPRVSLTLVTSGALSAVCGAAQPA